MASLRLIKAKGKFYDFYQRLTGTGKAKIKAIVAVMCKLVRVIFAMFRDRQKYDDKKGSPIDTVIGKRNEVALALN